MVDRVYIASLPRLMKDFHKLKEDFANLSSRTDWTKLRIDPLLSHLNSLEQLLKSEAFAQEFSRLSKGVVLFHSDLVYFRTNVQGLKKILESEKRSQRQNNR